MNRLRPFRARRRRRALIWLTLLALLFQQIALAGYACPIDEAPSPSRTVMAGCEGMAMPDADAPMLCHQHCLRGDVASSDAKLPQVPALGLPPPNFTFIAALLPSIDALRYEDVPICRSDPPPAQRFCSLQL